MNIYIYIYIILYHVYTLIKKHGIQNTTIIIHYHELDVITVLVYTHIPYHIQYIHIQPEHKFV